MLTLIADHRTNAEIAATLGVAVATVKGMVTTLRDLTGCASKAELARWWRRNGGVAGARRLFGRYVTIP
ncbi:MAG: LuxR family transcriptional regulator [Dehalococcoidia bacterium]